MNVIITPDNILQERKYQEAQAFQEYMKNLYLTFKDKGEPLEGYDFKGVYYPGDILKTDIGNRNGVQYNRYTAILDWDDENLKIKEYPAAEKKLSNILYYKIIEVHTSIINGIEKIDSVRKLRVQLLNKDIISSITTLIDKINFDSKYGDEMVKEVIIERFLNYWENYS